MFVSEALAQTAGAAAGSDPLGGFGMMIPLAGMFVVMWFFMIRPQQKKQKELLARIAAIKTGDRVITVGGVHGVVTNAKDGPTLVLKVDDNCKLTVDKSAVVTVLPKDAPVVA